MAFEHINLDYQQVAIAGFGAGLLFIKMTMIGNQSVLGPLVEKLIIGEHPRAKFLLEFAAFVVLGAFAGVLCSEPVNAKQAIAAGFGWTALLSMSDKKSATRKKG